MTDCYLCGAYIERGKGYRREVHTSTSARFYMTRWGGTSLGANFGPRTVCRVCADQLDRLRDGAAGRCFLYFIGYALSAVLGWQVVLNGWPLLGVTLLLGIPVWGIAWLAEASRRSNIRDTSVGQVDHVAVAPHSTEPSGDARRVNETVDDWIERTLTSHPEFERRVFEGYAHNWSPPVGVDLAQWVRCWPEWNPEWDPAIHARQDVFREDDTIQSWIERNVRRLGQLGLCDEADMRVQLASLADYAPPNPGETLSAYSARATAQIREAR